MNNRAVILGYHQITKSSSNKIYAIGEDLFRKHLLWLKDNNFCVISLNSLCQSLTTPGELPENSVVLTFDDGLLSHFDIVLPILKEFNFCGCFFVIASLVGKEGFMDWQQLKRLLAEGMEIGSHGLSHNLLNTMSNIEIEKEFLISKSILEENLKYRIDFLSIPRGQDNLKIKKTAISLGYKAICSNLPGYINKSSLPISLNRFVLKSGYTFLDFEKILKGSLLMNFKIKTQALFFLFLRRLLGMRLYEKIRRDLLKEEYSH